MATRTIRNLRVVRFRRVRETSTLTLDFAIGAIFGTLVALVVMAIASPFVGWPTAVLLMVVSQLACFALHVCFVRNSRIDLELSFVTGCVAFAVVALLLTLYRLVLPVPDGSANLQQHRPGIAQGAKPLKPAPVPGVEAPSGPDAARAMQVPGRN